MPTAEVAIDEALVRELIAEQHGDLGDLPLMLLANGWDNVMYRLGSDLVVRLPRRQAAAGLIESEQRWLPSFAGTLPLPIPAPVRVGAASREYPWSWSIVAWMPGTIAARSALHDPQREAERLGDFLAALHAPAPADAPHNPFRGGPLTDRSEPLAMRITRLGDTVDVAGVRDLWAQLVATEAWSGPPLWLHGDLHAANLLVEDGAISGVIDFGDLCGGDPATDLAIAWMIFDRDARDTFRRHSGTPDEATWSRARGWALHFALAYLAGSADDPTMTDIGRRTLAAVLDD